MGDFNAQDLANIAWAFATACQSDALLFAALARAAERRADEFNGQNLANTAWAFATAGRPAPALLDSILVLDTMESQGATPRAFATVGWLDTTMVSVMSREVFEWIRGYKATRQIGEGLSSDFATHVTSVLWAFNFAGVLEPQFAEPVLEVLRIVGHEMDRSESGLGSHKMPRFREGSHSAPDEPCSSM